MGSQDWNTPPEIVEMTERLLGTIELDPFHNKTSVVGALRTYDANDDGLVQCWDCSTVLVNGPWNRSKDVVPKCVQEWLKGSEIVAIFPTSLNAAYWRHVEQAPATCRPRRRVPFLRDGQPVKGNRQDCVIVYWGPDIYRFRAVFSELGEVRFG